MATTFEVNGNQIQDKQDAIRHAQALANGLRHSIVVWEQDTGLPSVLIAPEIKIGRATA